MAEFVAQLTPKLRQMLGSDARLPRILCSDRGPGLYHASTGHIVAQYRNALQRHGFRTYAGEDASQQPADMADVWPHETAVAWIRGYMKKRPLKKGVGLPQMQKDFAAQMAACVRHINAEYEVDDLCSSFPERLAELRKAKGERLSH